MASDFEIAEISMANQYGLVRWDLYIFIDYIV